MTTSLSIASSVDEVAHELAQGARPVAGGTDLVVGVRQGKAPLPERLVAIHRVPELRGIEETAAALHLGALTTHAQVVEHPTVRDRLSALADASGIVGSHATRAQGTLGGNLMNASPAMETGGPLLCLGAVVRLRGTAATRTLRVDELLVGPGRTSAGADELLEAIEIPLPPGGTGSCYLRLEYRRHMEIAVVGTTAVLTLVAGRVTRARVAITALAPTIRRVPDAEAALEGSDGGAEAAAAAARAIAAAATPISDVRASAGYRTAMAAVVGRRAILVAAARARGDDVPIPASPALHGGLR